MAEHVTLVEMSPRDGLQNEATTIPTKDKIRLVDALSKTGLKRIEVTSFVSPKWVPQLADAVDVIGAIERMPGVTYSALTPNLKGFEAALAAGADEVAIFASASEGFSQANINCSIAESLDRFRPVLATASAAGIPVRGYISCVTDCPYDGPTAPASVADLAEKLMALGCFEVSLGDTIGAGTPQSVASMLRAVCAAVPANSLAGHYHDTQGRALENIEVSLDFGLRVFDTSAAGLGGCPFAPGAKGNVATEETASFLHDRGLSTMIDMPALVAAAAFARTLRSAS